MSDKNDFMCPTHRVFHPSTGSCPECLADARLARATQHQADLAAEAQNRAAERERQAMEALDERHRESEYASEQRTRRVVRSSTALGKADDLAAAAHSLLEDDDEEAYEYATRATKIAPHHAWGWLLRAQACAGTEDRSRAGEFARRATKLYLEHCGRGRDLPEVELANGDTLGCREFIWGLKYLDKELAASVVAATADEGDSSPALYRYILSDDPDLRNRDVLFVESTADLAAARDKALRAPSESSAAGLAGRIATSDAAEERGKLLDEYCRLLNAFADSVFRARRTLQTGIIQHKPTRDESERDERVRNDVKEALSGLGRALAGALGRGILAFVVLACISDLALESSLLLPIGGVVFVVVVTLFGKFLRLYQSLRSQDEHIKWQRDQAERRRAQDHRDLLDAQMLLGSLGEDSARPIERIADDVQRRVVRGF